MTAEYHLDCTCRTCLCVTFPHPCYAATTPPAAASADGMGGCVGGGVGCDMGGGGAGGGRAFGGRATGARLEETPAGEALLAVAEILLRSLRIFSPKRMASTFRPHSFASRIASCSSRSAESKIRRAIPTGPSSLEPAPRVIGRLLVRMPVLQATSRR